MFTGIIEARGRLVRNIPRGDIVSVEISASSIPDRFRAGNSVSVDGVCLTVTREGDGKFSAEVGSETLNRTTLRSWRLGRSVNLETPARLGSPLGGHLVQGHIDGITRVDGFFPEPGGKRLVLGMTADFFPYIVEKGSVALNGVSLTVTRASSERFEVFLIPYTLRETNLGSLRRGTPVNVELDLIGKYVERWMTQSGRIPGLLAAPELSDSPRNGSKFETVTRNRSARS